MLVNLESRARFHDELPAKRRERGGDCYDQRHWELYGGMSEDVYRAVKQTVVDVKYILVYILVIYTLVNHN